MPVGSDLINLREVYIVDTFETWVNRTNQIISAINPLQVYEVQVGATGGLLRQTGELAGNYNGVVTLSVNPGPGIATHNFDGTTRTIVDFRYYDDYGLTLTGGASGSSLRVASNDEYIVNDISDTSEGRIEGVAKKVKARHMLPPEIDVGDLVINGNLIVNGNLSTFGGNDFIASNDLRIEDKQIELAFQQAIPLTLTGVTGGTFLLGATAYYFAASTGLTPEFYGYIQGYTGVPAGPTAIATVGSPFSDPFGPEDFGATGFLSQSEIGSPRYQYTFKGSITSAFLNDTQLDEGGIVLKGKNGDKELLWIYSDNDTGEYYNGWMSNVNLGVVGTTNSIISRLYRSFGYNGINQSEFVFAAESTKNAELILGEVVSTPTTATLTGNTWKITRSSGNNNLVFSFGTGPNSVAETFRIVNGASGQTYPNVSVFNFARNFNVDMLDGAHAYTGATASSIPVSDIYGRIDENWLNAASLRRRFTVASHGFIVGDVLRINSSGNFVKAIATTSENAEVVGVVSQVHNTNEFTLTYRGRISGLNGSLNTEEATAFVTGNVYFLSANSAGKMIADPDFNSSTRLDPGEIRKPLLLATSATEGFLLGYVGVKLIEPTDQVYLPGLVPVGAIYPYAGSPQTLTSEWLICDGDVYQADLYPELYNTISRTYSGRIVFSSTGTVGVVSGGLRGLQVGHVITINGTNVSITNINVPTSSITVSQSFNAGTYILNPFQDSSGRNLFFVPDLRTRIPVGSSVGNVVYDSFGLTSYASGDIGGSETITLTESQLPPHFHNLPAQNATINTGISTVSVAGGAGVIPSSNVGSGTPIDIRQPYLSTHYIIRAKNNTAATILTGHNHDLFYVRYDTEIQPNFGLSGGTTAAFYRSKIGAAYSENVYTKVQSDGRYYTQSQADSRFINLDGDAGISGEFSLSGNTFIVTNDTLTFIGSMEQRLPAPFRGFNVIANPGAIGNDTQKTAFSVLAYNTGTGKNSLTETFVYGDLTVFGNGVSGGLGNSVTANSDVCFSVDSLESRVTIEGRNSRPPVMDMFNGGIGQATNYIGTITGLTFPTQFHHAANKAYVDNMATVYAQNVTFVNRKFNGGSDIDETVDTANPVTFTNLTPGIWVFHFTYQPANTQSPKIARYSSGAYTEARQYNSNNQNILEFHFVAPVESVGTATIQITQDGGDLNPARIRGYIAGYRLGR